MKHIIKRLVAREPRGGDKVISIKVYREDDDTNYFLRPNTFIDFDDIEPDAALYLQGRIVSCVNAFAGVENPEGAMKAIRAWAEADRVLVAYFREDYDLDCDDNDEKRIELEEKYTQAKKRAFAALGETEGGGEPHLIL